MEIKGERVLLNSKKNRIRRNDHESRKEILASSMIPWSLSTCMLFLIQTKHLLVNPNRHLPVGPRGLLVWTGGLDVLLGQEEAVPC